MEIESQLGGEEKPLAELNRRHVAKRPMPQSLRGVSGAIT
jgi:hypothetical protein